ncbi:SIR2 family protein [Mucilaginibacter rubeus]|uniref:SIR2 family protein n=1 Tax=Mucilaginibacter rubeus TaxID=2027860 RepID=A0AAE6JC14_9SPHI|nr:MULTISPECIES: SIR2 family protein [Mucilaginibacter]QEM02788.1 SIR2 family protein [Mucilaginibacter rubeus]QEM15406.1 SIR2 family protein [Mucilaginibacter gossypii]QTE41865.1 SIR2 family protein [Mucilaginibacter rubeus]QTE48468.1 SIR2 family protein [Mucilaginibacter rubeus]QTE59854.1 SIR2 family protein [Mucilaginibacter rubeus]
MINWPEELIDDIARRRCVIVLGAGVSKNSTNAAGARPKDWKEFLISASEDINGKTEIRKQIGSGDFLTACELIKKELGRDDFNSLMRREFLTPQFQPADIHKFIYNLDSRFVITPNFDKIYDTYANTTSHGSIIVKKFTENDIADCIRRPEHLIIKIHGSVESPDNLIFTRKDYSESRTKYRDFYHLIDALSITHTFVFVGCGTNDPDIRLILEDYSFKFPQNKKHYIIMPKGAMNSKVREIISETMSLKALLYDSSDYHRILTSSIADLVSKVEIRRSDLCLTMDW